MSYRPWRRSAQLAIFAILLASNAEGGAAQTWGPIRKDHCTPGARRQVSAELHELSPEADWRTVCSLLPRSILGRLRTPDRCVKAKFLKMFPYQVRGQWDVVDSACLIDPPPAPQQRLLSSSDSIEGFADIHVHQMANLGFGGSIVWGDAYGSPTSTLGPIPSRFKRGHDTTETAVTDHIFKTLINTYVADLFGHSEQGWPSFTSWPNHDIWTHQQAYSDWVFREYQGGLRLMVLLAVNSEDMFGRGENHLPPLIRRHKFQKYKQGGRTGNDMEALEWQVRQAYRLQSAIDDQAGGTGKGWYRIVRDPDEAGQVVAEGKLAVILGTEVQHLFNCDTDRPACTPEALDEGLNRLEAMGVNYVFPVHHKLNQFAGPATFQPLNSGPTETCLDLGYECSSVGLTYLGQQLIKKLASRGMLIDTEHMSRKAFDQAMTTVEALQYPVLAGHVVPLDLETDTSQQTERARSSGQLERIFRVGGLVAPILGTTAEEFNPNEVTPPPMPVRCESKDGGPDQWANAYLFIRDIAKRAEGSDTVPVPLGTDWNGFAGWPGPRRDLNHPCPPVRARNHKVIPLESRVSYPFNLPAGLVPAGRGGPTTLDEFAWPPGGRLWDYNVVGAAHAGMIPDFLENLRLLGLSEADLQPIYRSARGVVDLWKRAREIGASQGEHHLRWVPQSPFDVLPVDESMAGNRSVEAKDGYAICRTREGHYLGFLHDDRCLSIEDAADVPNLDARSVSISAYHAGRCLQARNASFDDDARLEQRTCNTTTSQLWQVRISPSGFFSVSNVKSGKCLALPNDFTSSGTRAIQQACSSASNNQQWLAQRAGNTFQLHPRNSALCLEVKNQSRHDGASIVLAPCTTASSQLWMIDSLRFGDFEKLYQADKNRYQWLPHPATDFSLAVAVDGSRFICRSHDAEEWVGVVVSNTCVGKTYANVPATTAEFDQLYQAP